ncbi:MAG TPA: SHOCT domain-containing protein [Acidimicrobiales bacterium]|nr:SHOCT domain-containing protein [Acidimicrobiales bacterium]
MLRRRPLLRTAATTAVVAGTATAVSGRMRRRQEEKYAAQDQEQYEAQAQAAQAQAAQAPAEDPYEQLKKLAELHDQGILTDEEFAAQKAKILG